MNENEALVTEELEVGTAEVGVGTETTVENAETTAAAAEKTPKIYTEAEFNTKLNEVIGKKLARKEAKIRREYDRRYGPLEDVLRAGTGKESVEEITDSFKQFYAEKGLKLPEKPRYSDSDIAVLAKAEAEEIIRAGDDEVSEEVNRLAAIGAANMTSREKAVFKTLAEHRQSAERSRELAKLGVTEDILGSDEFKAFAAKFNPGTPIRDVYDIYRKTHPQKEFKTMGSMKNSTGSDGTVKDFYTRDEALKFTRAELDKNPALFRAIEASMHKW